MPNAKRQRRYYICRRLKALLGVSFKHKYKRINIAYNKQNVLLEKYGKYKEEMENTFGYVFQTTIV